MPIQYSIVNFNYIVEPLRCFTCSASSNTSDCFHGNPQSQAMNATNCTNGATQCFANFISIYFLITSKHYYNKTNYISATNVSTTVSRGCSVGGCFPQSTINTTINCCNTDLCNSNSTTPQPTPPPPTQPPTTNRQCYSCSTNGNTTADPCYAGATNNPVMLPVLCTTGVSYCYRETTSKFCIFFFQI